MTKKEQTKDKIRQAAFKCVARFGFEKTTLDDIAKEVGLNKASLYYYYKNKEDIFLDITTNTTRQFVETLTAGTRAVEGSIRDRLRYFLYQRSVYYLQLVKEVHISEETLRQVEHLFWAQIQDVQAQERAFLATLLDQAQASGEIRAMDNAMLAYQLIAYSETLKELAKHHRADWQMSDAILQDVETHLDFMLELIFNGLSR